jgi:hypothetical protein
VTADAADAVVLLIQKTIERMARLEEHNKQLIEAGNALDECVNQFGDYDNWTHDNAFMYVEEALVARAKWKEAIRG